MHGSGTLIRWLLDNDLVDEMNLLIFPVVVGQGTRLFPDTGQDTALELVESRATPSGVTIQVYRPTGRPQYGTATADMKHVTGHCQVIGGLGDSGLSFACCASVLMERPVPVHLQAAVVPVISFQTAKRSAITSRYSAADSRCRRGRKCGEMPLNADRNLCACRIDLKRFIARSRCRVG